MIFTATLKSNCIKTFLNVLKAINFQSNTVVQISPDGLKFVVEESKCFQTAAYIQRESFSHYSVKVGLLKFV